MSVNASADKEPLVSHDRVCAVMSAVLRVAKAKGFTDEQLEELSGVKARCIKSYRVEGKEPSLSNALSLCAALGKLAVGPVLGIIGYAGRPLDESDELQVNAVVAKVLHHSATIAEAAADGRIDHIERPACEQAADEIIAAVIPISSARKSA